MNPNNGEIKRFPPNEVPQGWIPVSPGQFLTMQAPDGRQLVFVIKSIKGKDITLRLRINETKEANDNVP